MVSLGGFLVSHDQHPNYRRDVTRAVRRQLRVGTKMELPRCCGCDEEVKGLAPNVITAEKYRRHTGRQVIVNVYKKKQWQGTFHYHEHCYLDAGSPHGEMIVGFERPRTAGDR